MLKHPKWPLAAILKEKMKLVFRSEMDSLDSANIYGFF